MAVLGGTVTPGTIRHPLVALVAATLCTNTAMVILAGPVTPVILVTPRIHRAIPRWRP